jgi:hypothetical protein
LRVANIYRQIAEELGVREQQVEATVALLDGGATVPFVARYRKEVTGALDDAQLRTLEERLNYLRELEERRTAILNSVREQGKLDAALEAAILAATARRLEDIYLPFAEAAPRPRSPRGRVSRCPTADAAKRSASRGRNFTIPTRRSPMPRPRSMAPAPSRSNALPDADLLGAARTMGRRPDDLHCARQEDRSRSP